MKILVLMPLDEKWSYIATGLFNNLTDKAKEKTFVMNMFTEWQLATNHMIVGNDLPPHWNVATFGSIIKAREFYLSQESKNEDCMIIGNISPDFKFDIIFNFQDPFIAAPYLDLYVDKMKEVFTEPDLQRFLNFYSNDDSRLPLKDFAASGDFLSAYLNSDPHLDDIKQKYADILDFKEI